MPPAHEQVSRGQAAGGARVLFPFAGDDLGGSHVSALMLVAGLAEAGFRPVVALHRTDGPLADHLRRIGQAFVPAPALPLDRLRGRARARAALAALPRLRAWLRARDVDVVHTNDGRMHAAWGLAAWSTPARHLWHHRGDPAARGANWLAPLVADRIVTVSQFARPSRPVWPLGDRWSVVHSPFAHPPPPDRAAARARLVAAFGCPPEAMILGYVGLFLARKRPAMMADIVEAAARAGQRPVHAVLFGQPDADGTQRGAVLSRAAALGVADRIHLAGHHSPIEPWMAGLDALVVPALDEPFGRTLIEAMLIGTPVVASRHGGNVEAVRDGVTGHLADPGDPAAFAAALLRLRGDPAHRAAIVEAARREALALHGIAPHVARIAALYREMLEPGAARAVRRRPGLPARAAGAPE